MCPSSRDEALKIEKKTKEVINVITFNVGNKNNIPIEDTLQKVQQNKIKN